MTALHRLENRLMHYAWGSLTSLAELRGVAPSGKPEAELWMGAHPLAPSHVLVDGTPRSLDALIAAEPERWLGEHVAREFGRLPFLVKLLAAREPLSLQAHPSEAQARAGFARENAADVLLTAPHRSYKDPHHKPELIAALTPFTALAGFRPTAVTARLFASLEVPALAPLVQILAHEPAEAALRAVFEQATAAPPAERRALADATLTACRARATTRCEFEQELAWGVRIGELYPGDAGIVLALALNLVVLAPGEALHLPAGNLHAYLEGTGVEIMASSDNVLRGGLTPKHIDVAELRSVLDFTPAPAERALVERHGPELRYVTPTREFELSRYELDAGAVNVAVSGPELVAVTRGELTLRRDGEELALRAGDSALVPAHGGDYSLSGAGVAFRARVNV